MPPRIVQLERRHKAEIEAKGIDFEGMVDSFRGTAVHNEFERNLYRFINRFPPGQSPYIVERRLWDRICDRKISGKFDILYKDILFDLKTTKSWKKIFGDFTDWEIQQNIYKYFLESCGVKVTRLYTLAWYMDFDKYKAQYDPQYPNTVIETIKTPVWKDGAALPFLENLIEKHKRNEVLAEDQLDKCTEKEMWEKPTTYAVYKMTGNKKPSKASRVLDTDADAQQWIQAKVNAGDKSNYIVGVRPGKRGRCDSWCKVSDWCNQYKEWQTQGGSV